MSMFELLVSILLVLSSPFAICFVIEDMQTNKVKGKPNRFNFALLLFFGSAFVWTVIELFKEAF